MIWLDLLTAAIIIGALLAESKRQFGAALFDMLAVLGAVKLAKVAGPVAAHAVTVLAAPDDNQMLGIAVIFLVALGALLILAKALQDFAPLTLKTFDRPLGALLGFASGLATAHIVLVMILTANPASTEWGAAARKRPAVQEIVDFRSYHRVVGWLRRAGESP